MEKLLSIISEKDASSYQKVLASMKEDYDWLVDLLENEESEENLDEEELNTILIRGGIPSLPSHHIKRAQVVDKIKENLSQLAQDHFLVLHGMGGCGKSVLAAEVVRDPKITLQVRIYY